MIKCTKQDQMTALDTRETSLKSTKRMTGQFYPIHMMRTKPMRETTPNLKHRLVTKPSNRRTKEAIEMITKAAMASRAQEF